MDDFYLNSLLMGTFGKGFYGSAIEDSLRKKERRSAGTVAGAVERFCSVGGVGAFREVFTLIFGNSQICLRLVARRVRGRG